MVANSDSSQSGRVMLLEIGILKVVLINNTMATHFASFHDRVRYFRILFGHHAEHSGPATNYTWDAIYSHGS